MKTLIYFILLSTLLSCSKASLKKICDVDDPITELSWLAEEIVDANANSLDITVSKVILKNKESKKLYKKVEGFIVHNQIAPPYAYTNTYYNCIGEQICHESAGFIYTPCDKYEIIKEEELYRNY